MILIKNPKRQTVLQQTSKYHNLMRMVMELNFKKNLIPELELLIIGSIDLDEPFVNILVRSEVAEVGFIER